MAINLGIGQSKNVGIKGAVASDFTYASSDPAVATVNSSGVVSAVAAGLTHITITRKSDGRLRRVAIKVQNPSTGFMPTVDGKAYSNAKFGNLRQL